MFKFFFALASVAALAQSIPSAKVIYGADDRKDYYEVDPATARFADATAVLANPTEIEIHGSTAKLNTVPFHISVPICANEPFYHQPTLGRCSAFLIAPQIMVTAGHCISSESQCQMARFVFGFSLKSPKIPATWEVPVSEIYSCAKIIHTVADRSGEDFAIIKLDRAVDRHTPLDYRTVGAPQTGEPLIVIGFPMGLPTKIAGNARVRSVSSTYFNANLDTYGGNSGSVVVSADTGLVEGVLVRGDTDFVTKNGCYTSNICPDEGCRGEDVTLMSRLLPYLAQ